MQYKNITGALGRRPMRGGHAREAFCISRCRAERCVRVLRETLSSFGCVRVERLRVEDDRMRA